MRDNPPRILADHWSILNPLNYCSIRCDIANDREQQSLINDVGQKYPQLNALINNAGIQHNYAFADGKDHRALIDEEAGINFLAHLKLTDQLLPLLMKRVVISSTYRKIFDLWWILSVSVLEFS